MISFDPHIDSAFRFFRTHGGLIARVVLLCGCTPLALLAIWCVADWVYVKHPQLYIDVFGPPSADGRIREGVAIAVVAAQVIVVHIAVLRRKPGLAIVTVVLSILAAKALVLTAGILFHFLIGGRH